MQARRGQVETSVAVARTACSALWELRAFGAPEGQCIAVLLRMLQEASDDTLELTVFVARNSFRRLPTAHRPVLFVWLLRRHAASFSRLRQQPDWLAHVLGVLETLEEQQDDEFLADGYAALAHLLYESEAQDEKAVQCFERGAENADAETVARHAMALAALGRADEAMAVLAGMTDRTHVYYVAMGTVYETVGDFARALAMYGQCAKTPAIHIRLGRLHEKRGHTRAALAAFEAADASHSTPETRQHLLMAQWRAGGDADVVLPALMKLEEATPDGTLEYAALCADMAALGYAIRNWKVAVTHIEECLKTRRQLLAPAHVAVLAARSQKALLLLELNDAPAAEAIFEELRDIYASRNDWFNLASTLYNLGLVAERDSRFEEAVEYLQQCVTLEKSHLTDRFVRSHLMSMDRLASVLLKASNVDGARKVYEECLLICEQAYAAESADEIRQLLKEL